MILDEKAGIVAFRCLPFSLDDITLLEGPFLHAQEINKKVLLNYEPDRLLAKFRIEAGLIPRAEHYQGWEGMTLAGHSLGHYMSACAIMYQASGDPQFLDRVNYMVKELSECQAANGSGYIGAVPDGERVLSQEVGRGDIRARAFNLNGIWAPYYTMHKVMAGLSDAYRLCGNTLALETEKNLAGWLKQSLQGLSEDQMQEVLACEHGGMNEVLADLFGDTDHESWLVLSRKFHHREILDPLAMGEDILPGKHGNTQIPKLIGLARLYELTGDESDRNTAGYFWDRVVNHHSYVNGSHGEHEYFGVPDQLSNRLSSNTSESCNVYNMLKLTGHLFAWDASPETADFYERALINHILSSQHPETGRVLYFHSLQMGGHKEYEEPFWFTCCVGTGMENHSKYGQAIFYHSTDELYINQFIAAELNWEEKGLTLRQVTDFPEGQQSGIELLTENPVDLTLRIRYPAWADDRFSVSVNGKKIRHRQRPGSYISVRRTWENGDRLVVDMPFTLRLEAMPDDTNRVAVCYGPLVLAGDLGHVSDSLLLDPLEFPVLVTSDRDPSGWLTATHEEPNTFKTIGAGKPGEVTLKPLYAIHDRSYTVYWDMFDEERYQKHIQELVDKKLNRSLLESRTIDRVRPGPDRSSQNHNFQADNPGIYKFNGQNSVEARYGWFSYDLKVEKDNAAGLMVEYWGGFRGPREFEILVNGQSIAIEDFSSLGTNENREIFYEIPSGFTSGGTVTVKFTADDSHYAGPVFGIRTVRID